MTNAAANLHLLWRAGFGPKAEEITELAGKSVKNRYREIVAASAGRPAYIRVADNMFDGLVSGIMEEGKMRELTKEQKQQIRLRSREDLKALNLRWLDQMVNSPAQLREKMAFFWHGHFACRQINIFYQQQLLDIIRRNALGSFGNLLREVSKSASMLSFLNNQQNRKQHPNENFAREVMELFTLGRGNYTENDVKEAARAFTGWGFQLNGDFVFRKFLHDDGHKTVLGKTGRLDGDDVLDILLHRKETAYFITKKLYRFLVAENIPEPRLKELAESFYQSDYHIGKLTAAIFESDWFYDKENIGCRIKSPVELLVGVRRLLPMYFENEGIQLLYQRLLGQVLFYPPNVAGWPGGKDWIDSSSLMYRMQLAKVIQGGGMLQVKPRQDDDLQMGMGEAGTLNRTGRDSAKRLAVSIDWPVYIRQFSKISKDSLAASIASVVLLTDKIHLDLVHQFSDRSSREEYIRTVTLLLMGSPEYQMC
jgi:uncharacterized protein (DUF1800 family)